MNAVVEQPMVAEVSADPSERDEALMRERLEIYRAIIAGNLAEGFTQMPDQVREDPALSRSAKLVYEQLLRYTRQEKNYCWPSQQRIADDLVTMSRRTVVRALNELYERGYIEKWRRGLNRTNLYFINPLSFPGSFKRPWRGRGVLLKVRGPEIRATVDEAPQVDVSLFLSGKCQNDTSRSAKMTHPEVPNWHIKHTESKEIQRETDTEESKIRDGASRAAEKGLGLPTPVPTYSHIARETIGNEESVKEEEEVQKTSSMEHHSNLVASIEPSNPSKTEETGRPARAKEVEKEKTGKNPHTFEGMAERVGIAPEALEEMLTWLKGHKRPDVTPIKLQGVIPQWSRELGNADPHLVAANITQASKLYQYARVGGLSQQAVESCFEHAREAVRNHPEAVKKMAFFFTSLKLDILVALKQQRDLPATRSSIPDGYADQPQAKQQAASRMSYTDLMGLSDEARRVVVEEQRARANQRYTDLGIDREALMAMEPEERIALVKQRRAQLGDAASERR